MPERVAARIERDLGSLTGAIVLVRAVAYRGGVKETASANLLHIVEELRAARRR